jgi:glycosyltransferase involved in cell wall biosynthesis
VKTLIIIPAYNEEKSVGRLVQEIHALHPQYDIVVINDCSLDRTKQAAQEAGAIVVNNPYNLGIGGTMQTGFQIARDNGYDIAVQMDGDSQHDPSSLADLLSPILEGKLDLSVGSRFLVKEPTFRSTYWRRFGIRFFSVLLSAFTGVPLTDPTSGYRAISRKLIIAFAAYYPSDFPEPEAIQMAQRYQARIGEVPVKMRKRLGGVSSIGSAKALYYMLKVTLAILIDFLKKKKV